MYEDAVDDNGGGGGSSSTDDNDSQVVAASENHSGLFPNKAAIVFDLKESSSNNRSLNRQEGSQDFDDDTSLSDLSDLQTVASPTGLGAPDLDPVGKVERYLDRISNDAAAGVTLVAVTSDGENSGWIKSLIGTLCCQSNKRQLDGGGA